MDANDQKSARMPDVMILERRVPRDSELSSADVMKILRKRAAKVAAKKLGFEVQWEEKVT